MTMNRLFEFSIEKALTTGNGKENLEQDHTQTRRPSQKTSLSAN
jgi:hypothetical protein